MLAHSCPLTAEEFAALPTEGLRLELVRGEIVATPPAFGDHGGAAMRVGALLGAHVTPEATAASWIPIVPDLVVEVVSSSDKPTAMAEKVRSRHDAGVRLVWVVSPPQRTVEEHAADQPVKILFESDTLDGGRSCLASPRQLR